MFVTHSMYIQVVNIQVIGSQVELFKDLKRRVERVKCSTHGKVVLVTDKNQTNRCRKHKAILKYQLDNCFAHNWLVKSGSGHPYCSSPAPM